MNSNNLYSPIFVLGTQRSGTTLLCRMLSAHPDLFIQNELNVRRMFGPDKSKNDIINSIYALILEDQDEALDEILHKTNKKCWGLKDPELTYYMEDLEKFLPESKFVIIVRDGRAVVNSYMENKWGLGTNAYTGALRWDKEVRMQLDFFHRHPDNVHLLRYEDLITDQEQQLRKLCGFLDLSFHEDLLNYDNKPTYYHKTRENISTFAKPRLEMISKWESKLSSKERDIIESVCKETLQGMSYPLLGTPYEPGRFEKLIYRIHQKVIGEFQIQYRWRISMVRGYFRKRTRKRDSCSLSKANEGKE